MNDSMVVADLTGHNGNVFYELAIRHVVGKALVQIIEQGEPIPFDVASLRTIKVNYRDLDKAAAAREELERQILSAEKDPSQVDNPISSAIDLTRLRESKSPQEVQLARILEGIAQIGHELASFRAAYLTGAVPIFPGQRVVPFGAAPLGWPLLAQPASGTPDPAALLGILHGQGAQTERGGADTGQGAREAPGSAGRRLEDSQKGKPVRRKSRSRPNPEQH